MNYFACHCYQYTHPLAPMATLKPQYPQYDKAHYDHAHYSDVSGCVETLIFPCGQLSTKVKAGMFPCAWQHTLD